MSSIHPHTSETKHVHCSACLSALNKASTVDSVQACNPSSDSDRRTEKRFEALAVQFSSLVLLSTFAATLVISFLSLAHDIIQDPARVEFQVGMSLCFIAAGTHLSLVLVAGRAATLAFRHAKPHPLERRSAEEDERYLTEFWKCRELCEQMQVVGTTIFAPALLFMVWFMFDNMVFTILLYALVCVGGIWVYIAGFWRISVLGSTVARITGETTHTPSTQSNKAEV